MNHNQSYKMLLGILLISLVIMYGVMFLNVYQVSHIYLSLTRLYMSILMVAPMAVLMITFMSQMYKNKKLNKIFIISAIVLFTLTLSLLRTQTPIGDSQYMRAMISHHSSAILTSKHAKIIDPEVRRLADSIIVTQQREIAQMKSALQRLK